MKMLTPDPEGRDQTVEILTYASGDDAVYLAPGSYAVGYQIRCAGGGGGNGSAENGQRIVRGDGCGGSGGTGNR